jgi:signal transduction histidine kinase
MVVSNTLIGVLVFHYSSLPESFLQEIKSLAEAVAQLMTLSLEHERVVFEREEALSRELALKTSRRYMEEFLSMASHELRTPLTIMQTNLQWLQRKLKRATDGDALSPELKQAIHKGFEESHHQIHVFQHLIDDLLDVTRIQASKLRLYLKLQDLRPLVSNVVENQRQVVAPREILLNVPACSDVMVCIDATRIEQVLSNYLTNAFKYTPDESPVKVSLSVEACKQRVRVLVEDQGPGITPEDQYRIWNRFDQIEGRLPEGGHNEGLGLGLFISKAIIEQHQGEVGVESSIDHGATFWFTLPCPEYMLS